MSWIAVGLTVVGTGLSIAGQEVSKAAMERAMSAEQERQRGFQKRAEQTFSESLSKSGVDTANQELDKGTEARTNAYAVAATQPQGVALPVNKVVAASGPTARAGAISKASQNAWSKAVGGSQAKLGAQQDWLQTENIKNARANQDLSVIGNESAGSARVGQTEVQLASHAGDTYGQIGQILSMAGMLVGIGGATGALGSTAGTATDGGLALTPAQLASQSGADGFASVGSWAESQPAAWSLPNFAKTGVAY